MMLRFLFFAGLGLLALVGLGVDPMSCLPTVSNMVQRVLPSEDATNGAAAPLVAAAPSPQPSVESRKGVLTPEFGRQVERLLDLPMSEIVDAAGETNLNQALASLRTVATPPSRHPEPRPVDIKVLQRDLQKLIGNDS